MSVGMMELQANDGRLEPHRHEQAEVYFIFQGSGVLSVDGVDTAVTVGDAAYIPGNALHALRNETDAVLRVFYVFPTDSFSEIVYQFPT